MARPLLFASRRVWRFGLLAVLFLSALTGRAETEKGGEFVPLFPTNGVPQGWTVRAWDDVARRPAQKTEWKVVDGVLHGGEPRGTWLMSERKYGNFILEFSFKLGERGNSGCALRAPMWGDPAFDGMELQMADKRYDPDAKDAELTGALYRAVAPREQVYKPTEWNRCRIMLLGSDLRVELNGVTIQDINLAKQNQPVKRHDGTPAKPLKERLGRGHIGFQELSRGGEHVQIRDARIKELD